MGFTFEADLTAAKTAVTELLKREQVLSPVMADLAEGLLHRTEDRFDTQTSPDGDPWENPSPAYLERKLRKGFGDIGLVRSGRLRGEMRPEWGDSWAEVVAPPLPYSAIHQFGGTDSMPAGPAAIPARPYMGLSEDDVGWVVSVFEAWLDRLMSSR